MNVIDSFVVEFGLDPSKFTVGQRTILQELKELQETARRGGDDTERQGKKITDTFTAFKREAIGFAALFLGGKGIADFFTGSVNFTASMGRTAAVLNTSTRELSAWQLVAREAGGTAQGVTADMQSMADQINRFRLTGNGGELLPLLNTLDIGLYDTAGKLKTVGDLWLEINKAIGTKTAQGLLDPGLTRSMMLGMGMSTDTANMLMLPPSELQKRLAEGRKRGGVTDIDVKTAQDAQKAIVNLDTAIERLTNNIVTLFGPAVTWVANRIADLALGIQKIPGVTESRVRSDMEKGIKGEKVDVSLYEKLVSQITGRAAGGQHWQWDNENGQWTSKPMTPEEISAARKSFVDADKRVNYDEPIPRTNQPPPSPTKEDPRGLIPYIRSEAIKNNVDPNIAVKVAMSEGLGSFKSSIPGEESYTAFQLNMGPRSLGTRFQKETGLDPRDPENEKAAIAWVLAHANETGWGPYHGARNRFGIEPREGIGAPSTASPQASGVAPSTPRVQVGGMPTTSPQISGAPSTTPPQASGAELAVLTSGINGIGSPFGRDVSTPNVTTNTTTINGIVINTKADDANGIAADIGAALKNTSLAAQANTGQE